MACSAALFAHTYQSENLGTVMLIFYMSCNLIIKCMDFNIAGTMNAGMGFTQARTLLASMNIPGISQSAFKVREWEAGPATEKVAKDSCDAALDMEKSLCAE